METESTLKKVGGFAFGAVVLLGIALLIGFLVGGMVWASEKVLPWLIVGGNIAFVLCVFVFLPLAVFRRARPWAGLGLYVSSYVFGIGLFAYSCIYTVQLWGFGALFLGLFLAGVGVVPVAFFATLLHKAWPLFWDVVYGVVMTYGTRYLGARFADSPAPKEDDIQESFMEEEQMANEVPTEMECPDCHGTGTRAGETCSRCGGSGTLPVPHHPPDTNPYEENDEPESQE